jgi:hypothetical protein
MIVIELDIAIMEFVCVKKDLQVYFVRISNAQMIVMQSLALLAILMVNVLKENANVTNLIQESTVQ